MKTGELQRFYTTYLLPSFKSAIAMHSLDLRNISMITMMASITESKITKKKNKQQARMLRKVKENKVLM